MTSLRRRYRGLAVQWLLGPMVAAACMRAAGAEPGTWHRHEYSFAFMGFTSTYSCDGLASKLKILLLVSGARPDSKATPGACASGFGRPDKFARADLTFYTLVPEGTVEAAGTVSGAVAADSAASTAPVDGVWIPIVVTARKPRDLATGDCELVEQFRSNVLPMFATRNVASQSTCVPHQNSGSVIDMKFEGFTTVPRGGPKARAPNLPR